MPFVDRPVIVPDLDQAVSIATGGRQTCVVRAGGELRCFL
jgi:hypothetical protein